MALIVHLRAYAEEPAAQQSLGEDKVQFRQLFLCFRHGGSIRRGFSGQRRQDPGNLLLFLQFPLFQLIAHFHRGHGFNEQRRAGRALVMDQARYAGAEFRLYRQHIPVVSYRDDRILQGLLQSRGVDHLVQLFPDPVLRAAQVPPDVHQLTAGPVGDLVFGNNSVRNILFNVPGYKQAFRLCPQDRRVFPVGHKRVLRRAACPQQLRHVQQHPRAQASAFLTDHQRRLDIRESDQRMPARILQDHGCFFCLCLQRLHGSQLICRFQHPALLCPGLRQRAFSQDLADPGKLQHPQRSLFHTLYNSLSLCLFYELHVNYSTARFQCPEVVSPAVFLPSLKAFTTSLLSSSFSVVSIIAFGKSPRSFNSEF